MPSSEAHGAVSRAVPGVSGVLSPDSPGKRLQRPNSRVWRRLRRRVLDRDGWRCVRCSRAGRLEVDHIVPMIAGGSHEMTNLQTLCRPCHFAKTAEENSARSECPERAKWREFVQELRDV